MRTQKHLVITTVQDPTPAVEAFLKLDDWRTVIVGDRKTPRSWEDYADVDFLDLESQRTLFPSLADQTPLDHYARKNLGYLYAMSRMAPLIAESDDDNAPLAGWGLMSPRSGEFPTIVEPEIANIYAYFAGHEVWPRGFPLERVLARESLVIESRTQANVLVDQQLVDGEPDVDAVFRLVLGSAIQFRAEETVVLDRDVFAPFNSQNTFWRPDSYLCMYLPSTVSFRATDILRGWVAQRCLWMVGGRLSFSAASVFQDRNEHDLLKDFESEVPLYLETVPVLEALKEVPDHDDVGEGLLACYDALADIGFVHADELPIVESWVSEIRRLAHTVQMSGR